MTVPTANDILRVQPQAVAAFIQQHTATKTLSRIVKQLNRDLLDGDAATRAMAARALDHLGLMIAD
jgi:3-methyladenine DNA glycosylase AlkC